MWGHVQVVAGMLQSQNMVSLNIGTLVVTSIVIALSFLWFLKYKNVNIWLSQLFSLDGSKNYAEGLHHYMFRIYPNVLLFYRERMERVK